MMKSCFVKIDKHMGVVELEGSDDVKKGDMIVCELEKGMCVGKVITDPLESDRSGLKKIIRIASPEEIEEFALLQTKERDAFEFCRQKIAEMNLSMKLLSAEYLFGGTKLLFYFVSENRVDFRELVKELAKEFKIRIELRQVGVRDESRMIGGLGNCGNVACCRRFLGNFSIVSIKMVKEQGLALNPSKISGICGRLMCCLSYEYGMYAELKKDFPKVGKRIRMTQGEGKVIKHNSLHGTFVVELDDGKHVVGTPKDIVPGGPVQEKQADAPPRKGERKETGRRSGEGEGTNKGGATR